MALTYEWHKAIKLNYKNTRNNAVIDLGFRTLYMEYESESADVTPKVTNHSHRIRNEHCIISMTVCTLEMA
jgi:hypothetical protein